MVGYGVTTLTCTPKMSSVWWRLSRAHSEDWPCSRLVHTAISPQVTSAPKRLQIRRKGRLPHWQGQQGLSDLPCSNRVSTKFWQEDGVIHLPWSVEPGRACLGFPAGKQGWKSRLAELPWLLWNRRMVWVGKDLKDQRRCEWRKLNYIIQLRL